MEVWRFLLETTIFRGELLVLVRECNPTYGGLFSPHLQPVFKGPLGTLGSWQVSRFRASKFLELA